MMSDSDSDDDHDDFDPGCIELDEWYSLWGSGDQMHTIEITRHDWGREWCWMWAGWRSAIRWQPWSSALGGCVLWGWCDQGQVWYDHERSMMKEQYLFKNFMPDAEQECHLCLILSKSAIRTWYWARVPFVPDAERECHSYLAGEALIVDMDGMILTARWWKKRTLSPISSLVLSTWWKRNSPRRAGFPSRCVDESGVMMLCDDACAMSPFEEEFIKESNICIQVRSGMILRRQRGKHPTFVRVSVEGRMTWRARPSSRNLRDFAADISFRMSSITGCSDDPAEQSVCTCLSSSSTFSCHIDTASLPDFRRSVVHHG